MINEHLTRIRDRFFRPGHNFRKTGECPACKESTGYRTNGNRLFRDTNCSCKPIQPLKSIDWHQLLESERKGDLTPIVK